MPMPEDGAPIEATTAFARCLPGAGPGPGPGPAAEPVPAPADPVQPLRAVLRHRPAAGRGAGPAGRVGRRAGRGAWARGRAPAHHHGRRVAPSCAPMATWPPNCSRYWSRTRSPRIARRLRLQKGEVWVVQSTGSSLAIVDHLRRPAVRRPRGRRRVADHYADCVMRAPNRFDPASVGVFRVADRIVRPGLGHRLPPLRPRRPVSPSSRPSPSRRPVPTARPDPVLASSGPCSTCTSPREPATTRRPPRRRVVVEGETLDSGGARLPPPPLRRRPTRVRGHQRTARAPSRGRRAGHRRTCRRPGRPRSVDRPGGLVVPIGGGKDSMVLIEAVNAPRAHACSLSTPIPLVQDLARQTGLELIVVRRRLDPGLDRAQRLGRPQRPCPDHRHRLAHRRGGQLPLRLRLGRHGRRTLGQRGDGAGRRGTGEPPVLQEHRVRTACCADLIATSIDPDLVLRLGPASLLRAGHRPGLRRAHPLPRHLLQLQLRRSASRRRRPTGGAATARSAASSD